MSDPNRKPADLIDPPPRFGMRSVLVAITAGAIAMASLAPALRQWEGWRWLALGQVVGAVVVGVLVGCGIARWSSWRRFQQVGARVVWLVRTDSATSVRRGSMQLLMIPVVLFISLLFGLVVLLVFFDSSQEEWREPSGQRTMVLMHSGYVGVFVATPICFAFRKRSVYGVAMGEGGIYLSADQQFYPWSILTRLTEPGDSSAANLTFRVGGTYPKTISMAVPAEFQLEVEELLTRRLPPAPS